MTKKEIIYAKKQRDNISLLKIHKMLASDLLFFYTTYILFLLNVRNLQMSNIVLAGALYGIFKVICQVPSVMIIEKLGYKASIIIGDSLLIMSIILIIFSTNPIILYLAYLFMGMGYPIKDNAEESMLLYSIPNTDKKSEVFAKTLGKSLSRFFIVATISAAVSGFLFKLNPYIPLILCASAFALSLRIAFMLHPLDQDDKKKVETEDEFIKKKNKYFKELGLGFKYIFSSKRLIALFGFVAIFYSSIQVMNNYEIEYLNFLKVSPELIGIVYGATQLMSSFGSHYAERVHRKVKNRTLTIIGVLFGLTIFVAGLLYKFNINYYLIVLFVVFLYMIRYLCMSFYYVLIKKYMSNFAGKKILSKIYSAYAIVCGTSSFLMGLVATVIVKNNDMAIAFTLFGAISLIRIMIMLTFMRSRIGLKADDYNKLDINFTEFKLKNELKSKEAVNDE